jgi:hypothetical protein
LAQVRAGREGPASAGENYETAIGILPEFGGKPKEFPKKIGVQGIESFRSIQGHGQDGVVPLDGQVLIGHGFFPPLPFGLSRVLPDPGAPGCSLRYESW